MFLSCREGDDDIDKIKAKDTARTASSLPVYTSTIHEDITQAFRFLNTFRWRPTAPRNPHPPRQQCRKAHNPFTYQKSAALAHERTEQQHIHTSRDLGYGQTATRIRMAMALSDKLQRERHAVWWWT